MFDTSRLIDSYQMRVKTVSPSRIMPVFTQEIKSPIHEIRPTVREILNLPDFSMGTRLFMKAHILFSHLFCFMIDIFQKNLL